MSERPIIQLTEISAAGKTVEGRLAPADVEGLDDLIANGDGELRYRVTARLGKHRRKELSCIIEGFVFLTCHESQEAFRHEVKVDDRQVLVDDESELPPIDRESEEEDYRVADGPIDVLDLVEEAVVLAMPMVPRKPGLVVADVKSVESPDKVSPFAALASLKRPK